MNFSRQSSLSKKILFLFVCAAGIITGCQKPGDLLPNPVTPLVLHSGQPNIILILGDDVGYEIPDYTGGQSYSTPNIDAMAASGIQFTHLFGSPSSSPSRFALLTGKYNQRNYNEYSWDNLGLDQKTIANMLQDNGYTTCVAGKWQLNHGDTGTSTFGFDKYCITDPFYRDAEGNSPGVRLYKNPTIYENGAYLPDSQMLGKYSEDVFMDYMFNFMDSASTGSKPFFVYWAPNLCHQPFSPTPDDPAFATWDPDKAAHAGDTIYFPSMVSYFDKDIGKLVSKLQASKYGSNTIVLFILGDNGTDNQISSLYNGEVVRGGKGKTYTSGIHLPFLAYAPGLIPAGNVYNGMTDIVDFLPTIAALANISVPATWGVLDGIRFDQELFGNFKTEQRIYCYNSYDSYRNGPDSTAPSVWAMDSLYKVYDGQHGLFEWPIDPFDNNSIKGQNRTKEQVHEEKNLKAVIASYQ